MYARVAQNYGESIEKTADRIRIIGSHGIKHRFRRVIAFIIFSQRDLGITRENDRGWN